MATGIIKCKYCGGSVTLTDAGHGFCDYCGQELTFPSVREERMLALYERAGHFRASGDFDRAYNAYQHLVQEKPKDPELHWCLTLCRYGVEYVEDKRLSQEDIGLREFKPTMSRMSFENILEDPDYKAALEHADETGRRLYRLEAGKLDQIQRKYLEIARSEAPYDVFISFKAQEEDGKRTKASELGQEIYEQLTEKGLKVFFSRITLENKLSEEYEPYIFAALHSARVMLLVADNQEQINSRWVKNEWSRFLIMAREDRAKSVVPVYNSRGAERMSPYDFPDEIQSTQAQDMGKIGAMQDLVRGVLKLTGRAGEEHVVVLQGGATVDNLLRRAGNSLQDGEFEKVMELTEEVLNADPENGQAYFYQFMAVNKAAKIYELAGIRQNWHNDPYYMRAKKFGGERQEAELKLLEEFCRKEKLVQEARREAEKGKYEKAVDILKKIKDYPSVEPYLEQYTAIVDKEKLLAKYGEEIGDRDTYLNRRFAKEYAVEKEKWDRLKEDAAAAEECDGMIIPLLASLVPFVYGVYVLFQYGKNSFGHTNADAYCVVWGVMMGVVIWLKGRGQRFFMGLVLPGVVAFVAAEIADMWYVEDMSPVPLLPWLCMLVPVLLLLSCVKEASLGLKTKQREKEREEYRRQTVQPIQEKLRREAREEWISRVGEENLIELGDIK